MSVSIGGPCEVVESGLALPVYDAVDNLGATADTDVFVFWRGGLAGMKVATVTIIYTDASKATILTVVKTVP